MTHRARLAVIAVLVGAVAFTLAGSGTAARKATPELRLGYPIALTGPIAAQAKQMVNGFNLYLDQHGGKLGGIQTKLLPQDSQADATTAIAKTRQLITQDKVHMIVGAALALESLAIIDTVKAANIAFMTPMSSADDLTQRKLWDGFSRPNMTSSQPNLYFGDYAYKKMGFRKIAIVAQDYAYGQESAGGFQYAFQKDGGQVTKKIYIPLNATDISPYVRQIPSDVDAVYVILVGAFVPRFEAAYKQSPLQGKVPLLGGPDMIDEDALAAAGKNAVGMIGIHEYSAELPTAKAFVTAYKAKYKETPSYWAEFPYIEAGWIDKAIQLRESKGVKAADIPDWIRGHAKEFTQDLVATKVNTPQGPIHMDKYHNPVVTLYVFKVTSPGHKKVLATIPNASQFWTESPAVFLKHPAFSRTYP
jgi:branched-chain amino acid transport system substrate-binding protein